MIDIRPIAREIALKLSAEGFPCTSDDVAHVVEHGCVEEGVIGPEFDEALTDRIVDALDARGITTA